MSHFKIYMTFSRGAVVSLLMVFLAALQKPQSPPGWWIIFLNTFIWKVSIGASLNTRKCSEPLLCCGFSEIHFPAYSHSQTKHQAHLSPTLSFKCFFFFFYPCFSLYTDCVVWQSRLKVIDVVILQQLYHFLPADSTKTAYPHEKREKESVTPGLKRLLLQVWNYCLSRCRWSGQDDITEFTGKHTSHWCLCSCRINLVIMMLFRTAWYSADVWFCSWWMVLFICVVFELFSLMKVEVHNICLYDLA